MQKQKLSKSEEKSKMAGMELPHYLTGDKKQGNNTEEMIKMEDQEGLSLDKQE